MNYYVYILETKNGLYYTGYTNDLKKRIENHKNGKAAKFTRAFKVKKFLIAWQINSTPGDALKVEYFIKKQNRKTKEIFIKKPSELQVYLKKINNIKVTPVNEKY